MDVFGIADDFRRQQDNYQLPEGRWVHKKGIESVGSMLFDHLTTNHFVREATEVGCFSDNCAGQNKSKYMVQFWAWWVCAAPRYGSSNKALQHNFCLAGHCKCFCDGCFGMIKHRLKQCAVYSPAQLYHAVNESSKCNTAVCGSQVTWYDWKAFLGQFFRDRPFWISEMHHLRFDRDHPGRVQFKDRPTDPWQQVNIRRAFSMTPAVLQRPEGHGLRPLSDFKMPLAVINATRMEAIDGLIDRFRANVTKGAILGDCMGNERCLSWNA